MWRPIATQLEGLKVLGILIGAVVIAIPMAMFCIAIMAGIFNSIFHEWEEEEENDDAN